MTPRTTEEDMKEAATADLVADERFIIFAVAAVLNGNWSEEVLILLLTDSLQQKFTVS